MLGKYFVPMLPILIKYRFATRNVFLIKQDFSIKIIHSIFRRIFDYFEYSPSQFGLAELWVAIFILFSSVFVVFNINIHLVWLCFCFRCYWINCRNIHPELYLCFVSKWPMSLPLTQENDVKFITKCFSF